MYLEKVIKVVYHLSDGLYIHMYIFFIVKMINLVMTVLIVDFNKQTN